MATARRQWKNRIIILLVIAAPIAAFVALQAAAAYTRAGTVDAVWFADTRAGPRIVARDQIVAGTERAATVRDRLVLVDASNGERIAREKVEAQMDFVGAVENALWFKRRHGAAQFSAFDATTLDQLEHPAGAAPAGPARPLEFALTSTATIAGERVRVESVEDAGSEDARLLDPAQYIEASFLVDEPTSAPISLDGPASAVVVHRPASGDVRNTILVSRIGADLKPLWTATLDRQRHVRAAHVVGNTLVIATSGVARDFAVALDLKDGHTVWVHYF